MDTPNANFAQMAKKPGNYYPSGSPARNQKTPYMLPKAGLPKKTLYIIIAFFALLIIIVGMSLAFRIWDPSWNPFRLSPASVMDKAMKNMQALKTLRYNIRNLNVSGATYSGYKTVVQNGIEIKGESNNTDPNNRKFSFLFENKTHNEIVGSSAGNTVKSDASMKGEIRGIGKDYYLTFDKMEGGNLITALLLGDTKQYQGKWFKIDTEKAQTIISGIVKPYESVLGIKGDEVVGKIKEVIAAYEDLLLKTNIFTVKQELPEEKINNITTYHYYLVADKTKLKKAISEKAAQIFGNYFSDKNSFEKVLNDSLDNMFKNSSEVGAEIWIGKKDKLIYKIRTVDMNASSKQSGEYQYTEISYSDFNKPISIQAPAKSQDLVDIIKPFVDQYLLEFKLVDSMSQIIKKANSIYEKDSNLVKLACDSEELKSLCEVLEKTSSASLVIKKSKDKFCAYLKISESQYYCFGAGVNQLSDYALYPPRKVSANPSLKGYCDGKTFACPVK